MDESLISGFFASPGHSTAIGITKVGEAPLLLTLSYSRKNVSVAVTYSFSTSLETHG